MFQAFQPTELKYFSPSLIVPLATIRDPTSKCTSIKKRDIVNNTDKELWEYFADSLTRPSKAMAKTKVGLHSMALSSSSRNLGASGNGHLERSWI
jgi:hypothetical protein